MANWSWGFGSPSPNCLGNMFAEFSSGQNFLVPKTAVQNPGWIESGLGWIKSLLGQRLYIP